MYHAEISINATLYANRTQDRESGRENDGDATYTLSRGAASVHIWHVVDVYHRRIRSHHLTSRMQKETRVVSEGIRAGREGRLHLPLEKCIVAEVMDRLKSYAPFSPDSFSRTARKCSPSRKRHHGNSCLSTPFSFSSPDC